MKKTSQQGNLFAAPAIIPTREQQAVYHYVGSGSGNLVINAVAGSGKTTSIVEAIKRIPDLGTSRIAFIAFNKHIKEELRCRLPRSVTVATCHSLGFSFINRSCYNMYGRPAEIDFGNRLLKERILGFGLEQGWFGRKKSIEQLSREARQQAAAYVKTLVGLMECCKMDLVVDTRDIARVALKYELSEVTPKDCQRLSLLFYHFYFESEPSLLHVSYSDMVFLPAMQLVPVSEFDYLFIDEAQDCNKAQQRLFELVRGKSGRMIAVGDPNQAIYSFAGADAGSFEWFSKQSDKELSLSCSFRCARKIVELAQTLVPHITPAPQAPQGIVDYGSYQKAGDGDFVLCRYNAPLVGLCFEYIRSGRKASIKGTDIGKQLQTLIRDYHDWPLKELTQKLQAEVSDLLIQLENTGMSREKALLSGRYVSLSEKVETLLAIASRVKTTRELVQTIDTLFADEIQGITLSSVHKAKGLEADRVFILGDDLMPAQQARTQVQIQQEHNLIYVAYTRARKELYFINDYQDLKVYDERSRHRSRRLNAFLGIVEEGLQNGGREPGPAQSGYGWNTDYF